MDTSNPIIQAMGEVREAAKTAGMNGNQLAKRVAALGCSRSTVYRILRGGVRQSDWEHLDVLAAALGISLHHDYPPGIRETEAAYGQPTTAQLLDAAGRTGDLLSMIRLTERLAALKPGERRAVFKFLEI